MRDEIGGEPDPVQALYAAIDEAVYPEGPCSWDRVFRDLLFDLNRDPNAPIPADDNIGHERSPRPDDQGPN